MKDSKKYYREVKKLFPLYGRKEALFLKALKRQIQEYQYLNYQELVSHFGKPLDIVISYYESIDSAYIIKKVNIKKFLAFILITLFFLITVYLRYYLYTDYQSSQYNHTVESMIIK
ncbi:DUF6120 family protein [Erysipelatoclostridium sp. AM42-17]|uniref:DUF6120 family protein n=1 Tax=Erysipelatoclostridium sp. AM42-17 TaxID=2293102 RepID=UPI000E46C8FF|nr:DUF6120 family protein [Erysipelatoclostridium sp. AM42-17]RHS94498.1 hypothetical protein DW911_05030 [Erysipelatoclostridium sp. AM42-17]